MFDNVKTVFSKTIAAAKRNLNKMKKTIKTVITGYFMLVVLLIITYYTAWLYQRCNGQIVMSDLIAVIKEMIGPAMIGFMTFIAGCFIDMNNNGIPDKFEEDKTHEKSNHS